MDDAGRLRRGRAGRDRPRPGLLGARGEEGLQAERPEASPGQLGQARFAETRLGQQLRSLVFGQLGQVGLGLGVQEDPFRGRDQSRQPLPQAGVGELFGVGVEDVQERLSRQQLELAQIYQVDPGRGTAGEQRGPGVQEFLRAADRVRHPDPHRVLAGLRFLGQPGGGLLQRLQVGEDQLGDDGLDVALWRHVALHVADVRVAEHPDDLAYRIGLADVAEELVAQPLALGRAPDQPRDVDEPHRGRDDPR